MTLGDRLPKGPAELIDRSEQVEFSLDGRPIQAYPGDTIGSAMAAAGVRITGRSFKYHRPRGLMCMTGSCPNCMCRIDGVPNVRACVTQVEQGMKVERQNGRPSVERDVQAILNRLSFGMPPGFYYKIFHKPRWVWPKVEPIIRQVAGVGRLPDGPDHGRHEKVNLHPDVLVIGGGAAGLAAAFEAARTGASTLVVEESASVGGHLRASTETGTDPIGGGTGVAAHQIARRLEAAVRAAGAQILTGTPVFGAFEGPLFAAANATTLYRIRPTRTIFATGAIDQPAVFPNNDLPGIMLARGVDRLLHLYRILPGRSAVVLALGSEAYRTASALADAGAVVTVVDPGERRPEVPAFRGTVIWGSTILRARGSRRVRGVEVGPPGATRGRRLACNLVVVGGAAAPSNNLIAQPGTRLAYDDVAKVFLPAAFPGGMAAAGEVAGLQEVDAIVASGRFAGLEAALATGYGDASTRAAIESLSEHSFEPAPRTEPPLRSNRKGKQFACYCLDVTDKELSFAVKEGFDSIELLKRYTQLSMGPCQGKTCLTGSIRLCAAVTNRSVEETGSTTARPPWSPVELRTLAAEELVPRKETAMNDLHADLGATFMWAGDWRRAHHYASETKEAAAVHAGVGVIDVSSLGKMRIKGPEAVALLERLYPNRFGDMAVGRVRYGVTLNDSGVILDDGAVVRLAEDEFLVTTTTSGTGSMLRWFRWWLTVWEMDAQILNVSGAYAAVNVTGPRSREVMTALTDADVSAEAMPYLSATRADVAGVAALILRIGFTGELGYEIHFPSAYGEHVWNAIVTAGQAFGIEPFGLEAQRILRLEKQHVLVGQDTDALSDPYATNMAWIVKMDKPDFLGRQALGELNAGRTASEDRLIGWTAEGAEAPREGAAIVDGGRWIGRVTSARVSAATGGVVGMARVPIGSAEDGRSLEIHWDGQVLRALVHHRPFYDPDGARLRS